MQLDRPEINEDQVAVVVDDCLEAILADNISLDECLARYPVYAGKLRDLLAAAVRVKQSSHLEPSPAFKNRSRNELLRFIRSNKSKSNRNLTFRYALIFASLVVGFLTTGTVFAQGAFPGDRLYEWKLASERAWRWTAADPISVDIKLVERRSSEVLAVIEDPKRSLRARKEYQNAELQLISEIVPENEDRINSVIHSQRETLKKSGVELPPVKIEPVKPEPELTPDGPSNERTPSQNGPKPPGVTGDAKSEMKNHKELATEMP